jgi:hypothetical protein
MLREMLEEIGRRPRVESGRREDADLMPGLR